MTAYPDDRRYDTEYSWVTQESENLYRIGVTAQQAGKVKEFVFIQLPEPGAKLSKGETYVSLESVKWSGHVASPLSGEVVEINEELYDDPARINADAYGSWIMLVRTLDSSEYDSLKDASEMDR